MPAAWEKPTDDSDYDLIALTLDRMEAAVGAGQRRQAEQARLEAYAFFEFGPERRLKSIDPGLATDIEGPDLVRRQGRARPRRADLQGRRRGARCAPRGSRSTTSSRTRAATLGDSAEPHDRRHQLGDHRLPRGPRGGADPRRHHRVVRRRAAPPAPAGADRRDPRSARQRVHVGARPDAAAVALALRREARGGGGPDRDRGAAADHELVLPPRLLERVDRALPPPAAQAGGPGDGRLLVRAGVRPDGARAHERLPRGLRDRAVPAVARAQRRRDRGRSRAPASVSRSRSAWRC